jgi:hypothetical protein
MMVCAGALRRLKDKVVFFIPVGRVFDATESLLFKLLAGAGTA